MARIKNQPPGSPGDEHSAYPEVVVGILFGLNEVGEPLVDWPGNPARGPVRALSTAGYSASDIGRQTALLFADGSSDFPIIVGLIREPFDMILDATELSLESIRSDESIQDEASVDPDVDNAEPEPIAVNANGRRVLIGSDKEIVLRCGKSSITLTPSGKVVIRAESILSRATGANKIKGGSVHIN